MMQKSCLKNEAAFSFMSYTERGILPQLPFFLLTPKSRASKGASNRGERMITIFTDVSSLPRKDNGHIPSPKKEKECLRFHSMKKRERLCKISSDPRKRRRR